jgi:hypothetical protein
MNKIEGPFVVKRDVQGNMSLLSMTCKTTTNLSTNVMLRVRYSYSTEKALKKPRI